MTGIVKAFQKVLSKSEATLEKPQACVSVIFRLNPLEKLEVLFIKRSISIRDVHSGQIAFPGGKIEENESNFEAVLREAREEIGVRLEGLEYLGHLNTKKAFQGSLRMSNLMMTCHVFYSCETKIKIEMNEHEVFSYRWVDFEVFSKHLSKHSNPKFNSMTHPAFRTGLNDTGRISGYFPGVSLPKSQFCESTDYGDYHLWGMTHRKMREITMSLPLNLIHVEPKDWVFYKLSWPNQLLNPYLEFLDTYFPENLTTNDFIL